MMKILIALVLLLGIVAAKPLDIECDACKELIQFAESELAKNATTAEITAFLQNKVCTLFPKFIQGICDDLVQQYLPDLVDVIQKDEPPQKACDQIGLCKQQLLQKIKILSEQDKPVQKQSQNKVQPLDIGCTICEDLVNFVYKELGTNATESDIENFLQNKVCTLFPKFLHGECDDLVQEYLPVLVALLAKGEPAPTVCKQVGLCSSSQVTPLLKLKVVKPLLKLNMPPKAPVEPENLECSACQLIINFAEKELGNMATQQEIEQFLNNTVCGLLPGVIKNECAALVDEYLPELVQYIQSNENATTICEQIGVCASQVVQEEVEEPKNEVECTICKLIVGFAEDSLSSNSTGPEIEHFLNTTVCGLLPSFLKSECSSLVDEYLPELVQWIQANEAPATACTQIGLCSSSPLSFGFAQIEKSLTPDQRKFIQNIIRADAQRKH